jgi:hypothetical protein
VDLLLYGLSSCAIIAESLLVAQDAWKRRWSGTCLIFSFLSVLLRMGPKTVFLSGLTMLGPFCGVDLLLYGLSSCAIIAESLLVAQDARKRRWSGTCLIFSFLFVLLRMGPRLWIDDAGALLLRGSIVVWSIIVCNHCGIVTRRTGCLEEALEWNLPHFCPYCREYGPRLYFALD